MEVDDGVVSVADPRQRVFLLFDLKTGHNSKLRWPPGGVDPVTHPRKKNCEDARLRAGNEFEIDEGEVLDIFGLGARKLRTGFTDLPNRLHYVFVAPAKGCIQLAEEYYRDGLLGTRVEVVSLQFGEPDHYLLHPQDGPWLPLPDWYKKNLEARHRPVPHFPEGHRLHIYFP